MLLPALSLAQTGSGGARYADFSMSALFVTGWSQVGGEELLELQSGAHDPKARGFTVQNLEMSVTGAIDPFLNGEIHIIFQIDAEGESLLEVEEAFLTTRGLPLGLQIRAGTYFTGFGRLNPQHPHSWSYVDQPLVNARLLGGDGLRGPGALLSWLTPLGWYSEITTGLQNANGETAVSFLGSPEETEFLGYPLTGHEVSGFADLLRTGRWLNSFAVGEETTVNLGFSGLWGPNRTGPDGSTAIYGGDLYLKWQPAANDNGWPFVSWQTEVMLRDYYVSPLEPSLQTGITRTDAGWYSQLQWGYRRGWVAGLRYEDAREVADPVDPALRRSRLAANLSYFPSEFSKVRLQFNLDDGAFLERENVWGLWLQYEFLMGQHGGHKF